MALQSMGTHSANGVGHKPEPATEGTVLDGVRAKVFLDRYSLKDPNGQPVEQYPEQMWRRVARAIAEIERTPDLRAFWEGEFYEALRDFRFVPGGRVLSSAGTGFETTFYNCFVIPSPDDSRGGILDNLKILTEIMARGGGVGVNLSTLRPRGSYIKTVNGTASGPVSWAELYSVITGDVIQQGGSRRGALMVMLDDDHPDVVEFIHAKKIDPLTNRPVAIEHANISVAVSDAFMQAVKDDADWHTQYPTKAVLAEHPELADKLVPGPTFRARDVWRKICESAWASAEPGVVFTDRYNTMNNTWYYQTIRCTNPCGEQGISPWSVCNLAALNLSMFVENGQMDYGKLAAFARVGMRFSDNVIDANLYFIKENEEEQLGTRRTGLGTMGLADALIKMGVRYGSAEATPVIETIYRTIRDAAYDESANIAAEKGVFPRFDRDKYLQGKFIQTLPEEIRTKIAHQGIRNAVILTQAPTGTTSLVAGVSSGIEPVFDFAFRRVDRTGESIIYHPLLAEWMEQHPDQERPDYFVGANDLTPEDHIRVQAMVQQYTDSSISKCVVGDTLIASERGLLPIADLYGGEAPDTFRPLGLRVASLRGEQTASDFYFGGIRPTLHVQLADGHEVTGTPNHRLLVGTADGLAWKRLDELGLDDYVALKIGAQRFGADVSLRGFQQSTTRAGYQKTISVPASMQPMLAHFLGAVVAEGCLAHYTVRITNNERNVLDRLVAEARTLFGVDGVIAPMGRNKALTVSFNSKSLCELLRFLGYVDGAANKVIPWSILQSSRESMVAFLSGLYLDGYVTPAKIGICLASRALINQLQVVLDNLGVQSWLTAKHNVVYDRDYYELNAHGQEAQRLARILVFDEAHKIERARALLGRTFAWSKSDVIPLEARHSIFAATTLGVRARHHGYAQSVAGTNPDRRLSWFGLRRLANDPQVPLTADLRQIFEEGLHFRQVRAVVDAGEQPVYDIAVPATEAFVANGIINHNTCNAPNNHTAEQVEQLYMLAYDSGCKGVTYYRDGSRDAVLHHIDTKQKEEKPAPPPAPAVMDRSIRSRPAVVHGYTRNMKAPEGTVNITLNSDDEGLLEVFVNVGRAGSDIAALAEALGRLTGVLLRLPSPLTPEERAREVVNQLRGIGGSRTVGFGLEQVRSLPDAIGLALQKHLEGQIGPTPPARGAVTATQQPLPGLQLTGNLCPECGSTAFVYEEGCKKCHACGHSEC